jgi:hypothetical protein
MLCCSSCVDHSWTHQLVVGRSGSEQTQHTLLLALDCHSKTCDSANSALHVNVGVCVFGCVGRVVARAVLRCVTAAGAATLVPPVLGQSTLPPSNRSVSLTL